MEKAGIRGVANDLMKNCLINRYQLVEIGEDRKEIE